MFGIMRSLCQKHFHVLSQKSGMVIVNYINVRDTGNLCSVIQLKTSGCTHSLIMLPSHLDTQSTSVSKYQHLVQPFAIACEAIQVMHMYFRPNCVQKNFSCRNSEGCSLNVVISIEWLHKSILVVINRLRVHFDTKNV